MPLLPHPTPTTPAGFKRQMDCDLHGVRKSQRCEGTIESRRVVSAIGLARCRDPALPRQGSGSLPARVRRRAPFECFGCLPMLSGRVIRFCAFEVNRTLYSAPVPQFPSQVRGPRCPPCRVRRMHVATCCRGSYGWCWRGSSRAIAAGTFRNLGVISNSRRSRV